MIISSYLERLVLPKHILSKWWLRGRVYGRMRCPRVDNLSKSSLGIPEFNGVSGYDSCDRELDWQQGEF